MAPIDTVDQDLDPVARRVVDAEMGLAKCLALWGDNHEASGGRSLGRAQLHPIDIPPRRRAASRREFNDQRLIEILRQADVETEVGETGIGDEGRRNLIRCYRRRGPYGHLKSMGRGGGPLLGSDDNGGTGAAHEQVVFEGICRKARNPSELLVIEVDPVRLRRCSAPEQPHVRKGDQIVYETQRRPGSEGVGKGRAFIQVGDRRARDHRGQKTRVIGNSCRSGRGRARSSRGSRRGDGERHLVGHDLGTSAAATRPDHIATGSHVRNDKAGNDIS